MSGTSLKVSGTGADQNLILADHALTASPADAAVRVHHDRTALHEGLDQSLIQCL